MLVNHSPHTPGGDVLTQTMYAREEKEETTTTERFQQSQIFARISVVHGDRRDWRVDSIGVVRREQQHISGDCKRNDTKREQHTASS